MRACAATSSRVNARAYAAGIEARKSFILLGAFVRLDATRGDGNPRPEGVADGFSKHRRPTDTHRFGDFSYALVPQTPRPRTTHPRQPLARPLATPLANIDQYFRGRPVSRPPFSGHFLAVCDEQASPGRLKELANIGQRCGERTDAANRLGALDGGWREGFWGRLLFVGEERGPGREGHGSGSMRTRMSMRAWVTGFH